MDFVGFIALVALLVIVVRMRSRLTALETAVGRLNALIPQGRSACKSSGARAQGDAASAEHCGVSQCRRPANRPRQTGSHRRPRKTLGGPPDPATASAPAGPREYGDFERASALNGWSGSAGSRSRSAASSWCATASKPGLVGPGMRIILGGLLALALVGLGEFTRRREVPTGLARFNTAHIPSVLTAAGTTVAYAVIYAAFALYNFLSPGLAFLLLGAGGAGHARGSAAARTCSGGAWSGRRLRDAGPDRIDAAELLGVVSLSHGGHRSRLSAGPRPAVALGWRSPHRSSLWSG
jgi:hypothetical protein